VVIKNRVCLSQVCVSENIEDNKYETKLFKKINPFTLIVLSLISICLLIYSWSYFPKQWLILSSVFVFLSVMTYILSIETYKKFINTTVC
jgi:hypothetical protein